MTVCERIQVPRVRVCRADFRNPVTIVKREIVSPSVGDLQASEQFTIVGNPFAAVKTMGGTNAGARGPRKFSGVNIVDQTTHLFLVPYADFYINIETGNHFVLHSGNYYRIISVDNINEDRLTVMFQCAERGDADNKATKA